MAVIMIALESLGICPIEPLLKRLSVALNAMELSFGLKRGTQAKRPSHFMGRGFRGRPSFVSSFKVAPLPLRRWNLATLSQSRYHSAAPIGRMSLLPRQ